MILIRICHIICSSLALRSYSLSNNCRCSMPSKQQRYECFQRLLVSPRLQWNHPTLTDSPVLFRRLRARSVPTRNPRRECAQRVQLRAGAKWDYRSLYNISLFHSLLQPCALSAQHNLLCRGLRVSVGVRRCHYTHIVFSLLQRQLQGSVLSSKQPRSRCFRRVLVQRGLHRADPAFVRVPILFGDVPADSVPRQQPRRKYSGGL
jgi:hypothetical protein